MGARPGKESGDIWDGCKEEKGETSDENPMGVVCSNEKPDFKGEETGEDEGVGYSGSE